MSISLRSFPAFPQRKIQSLNGLWDFEFRENFRLANNRLPDSLTFPDKMVVPGVFDILPSMEGKRGTAFYRVHVTVTPNASLMLKCGGLGLSAHFFWDNHTIGFCDLPYSTFELRWNAGAGANHELIVAIDNRFDYDFQQILSPYYDFYCHGGFFRDVELHELPLDNIDYVHVLPLDLNGNIQVRIQCSARHQQQTFQYVIDEDECRAANAALECGEYVFHARVSNPSVWSPEAPALHTIRVSTSSDTIVERFGIRTITAEHGNLLLNGKPLKLKGICRHEAHPQFGPALPRQIHLQDIYLMKSLGINFIRGTHYPLDKAFLEICDECGLLVWEETAGWGDRKDHLTDARFCDAQPRQVRAMLHHSFNHPSVIIHGFLNEADSSIQEARPIFEKMFELFHTLDPTRPVTYASMFHEHDLFFALADIIAINLYPAWYAANQDEPRPLHEISERISAFLVWRKTQGFEEKPLILSEIGAGAIYGWHDSFRSHWSEEYQADYLQKVCRFFLAQKEIMGIAIWQFCDIRTYNSPRALGRPRAFNNKGIFDEYRRPKLAANIVKSHFHG